MKTNACLSCDWPRAVPVIPGDAPMIAAGLPLKALASGGLDSQSIVFLRTPGTPWLYSGAATSSPSAALTAFRRSATTPGAPRDSTSALYRGIGSKSWTVMRRVAGASSVAARSNARLTDP